MAALEAGRTVDQVHAKTKIDRWFLAKLANIASLKQAVREQGPLDKLTVGQVRSLKQAGFSDRQLARYLRSSEAVSFGSMMFLVACTTLSWLSDDEYTSSQRRGTQIQTQIQPEIRKQKTNTSDAVIPPQDQVILTKKN